MPWILGYPDAYELNTNAGAKGLPNETGAVPLEVLTDPPIDVDRKAEVMLRSVDLVLEMQQVTARQAPHDTE